MWNFMIVLLAIILYCTTSEFFKLVDPVSYSVSLPDKFEGGLQQNEALEKTEYLFENTLFRPESFAVKDGQIYTGLADGTVVRLTGDKVVTVCRMGKECGGVHEEHICGRPLGMEFGKNGLLYVVDAYIGLFAVDVKTGKKTKLLSASTIVDDKALTFLNDLALDEKEDTIYLTQSSTKWNLSMVLVSVLEHDTSGRLLKFNLKTKEVSVLLTDLSFPNGVEVTHDGSALLIAEGNEHKIFKYHIHGPRKGIKSDLPLVLPGEPDNISKNKRGNYWVGIANGRTKQNPTIYDMVSEYPFLRKVFLHLHRLTTAPISVLLSSLPYKSAKEIGFELKNGRLVADLPLDYGLIVEFDDKGRILQSLHAPSGKVAHISEVLEFDGYLYLGSWRNRYLGRVKL